MEQSEQERRLVEVNEEISLLLNSMPMQVIVIGSVAVSDVNATKGRTLARLEAIKADLTRTFPPSALRVQCR